MPIYRPSARVTLQLRIDEFEAYPFQLEQDAPAAAAQASGTAAGASGTEAELERVQADLRTLRSRRLVLPPAEYEAEVSRLEAKRRVLQHRKASSPTSRPDALSAGAPDAGRVVIGSIIPRSVELERRGINSADKCKVTLDYADAPIDPRVLRSAGIDVVIGTVSPTDYEAGMRGETRADGSLLSLVPAAEPGQALASATRFVGWVDDWNLDLDGEDGDSLVLHCRDMTAIVIDLPLPPDEGVDLTLPLDQGIRELLDRSPTTRGIRVLMGKPGEENPPEAPTPSAAAPTTQKARRGARSKRKRGGDSKMSAWDHIQDVCGSVGFVPTFFGFDLHIIEPRTFFTTGGSAKRMIYGRNLESLHFAKKLGGVKVPTVEVRAYDPDIGRALWARYPVKAGTPASGVFGQTDPPRATRAAEVTPSGVADDRLYNISVRGITDLQTLERVARSTFEQLARQEIEGSFVTYDLESFDATEPADLLQLKAGDPVELLTEGPPVEPPVTVTSAQTIAALGQSQRQANLEALGWRSDLAAAIARATERLGDLALFRVAGVNLDWGQDDGLTLEVTFINFIVVRLGEDAGASLTPRGDAA